MERINRRNWISDCGWVLCFFFNDLWGVYDIVICLFLFITFHTYLLSFTPDASKIRALNEINQMVETSDIELLGARRNVFVSLENGAVFSFICEVAKLRMPFLQGHFSSPNPWLCLLHSAYKTRPIKHHNRRVIGSSVNQLLWLKPSLHTAKSLSRRLVAQWEASTDGLKLP